MREKLRLGMGGGVPVWEAGVPGSGPGELDLQGESGVGVVRSLYLSIGERIQGDSGTDSGEVTVGVDWPELLE